MKIPEIIYKQFKVAGFESSIHEISCNRFFIDVFLPHIEHSFWDDKHEQRNSMIMFGLKLTEQNHSEDSGLLSAIQNTACIPSRPRGRLVKPRELVEEMVDSPIAEMFCEDDERFIQSSSDGRFLDHDILNSLRRIGMMSKTIPDKLILERAKSIQCLQNRKEKLKRSKALTTYLLTLGEEYLSRLAIDLTDIPWVPVLLQRPYDFPFQWLQSESGFCRPEDAYSSQFHLLCGSVSHIHEAYVDELLAKIYKSKQPNVNIVLKQLEVVVQSVQENEDSSDVQRVIDAIYHFLNNQIDELKTLNLQVIQSNTPLIWTRTRFIESSRACICFPKDMDGNALEPYMYKLPDKYMKIKSLFELFCCNHQVTFKHLIDIQKEIQAKYESTDDPESVQRDKRIVMNIVEELAFLLKTKDDNINELMLPVITSNSAKLRLVPVEECVYTTDNFFLEDVDDGTSNIPIMDRTIGIEIAEKLGVQSLASRIMSGNDANEFEPWGQTEPLTTRIKGLIEDYDDGFAIPKELVQNADDAGATVVRFLYDERANDDYKTGLLDEGMAECQGPALWVYNNAEFLEDDFKNITQLAGRTKESDKSKIGKFGLGFCCVYNITDVPSFVSGNSVVILDPHATHLNKAIKNKSSPGIRMKFGEKNQWLLQKLKNQFMPFNKVFGCDFRLRETTISNIEGTLFRLPLRTKKQAIEGTISGHPYSKEDMKVLLRKFAESVGNLMIFTQNIQAIEVYHLHSDEDDPNMAELLFKSHRTQVSGNGQMNILRKITGTDLRNMTPGALDQIIELCVHVETTNAASRLLQIQPETSISKWFVSSSTGSDTTLQKSFQLERKGAVPLGSVAMSNFGNHDIRFEMDRVIQSVPFGFHGNKRLFCFLPLPTEVPIPVYINGCFFVEKNRKSLHISSGDEKTTFDEELQWNKTVIEDAVCKAYLNLVSSLPKEYYGCHVDRLTYNVWPRLFESSQLFHPLVENFYRSLASSESRYKVFVQNMCKFAIQECIFLDFSLRYNAEIGDIAFQCFLEFNNQQKKVIDLPEDIYMQFQRVNCEENLPCISVDEFFTDIFFQNISSDFWKGRDALRNLLVVHAIALSNRTKVSEILKQVECIPTRPRGRLRRPCDIVQERTGSIIQDMFSEDDERFIEKQGVFDSPTSIEKMVELGMMTEKLPDDLVCERAQSVVMLRTDELRIKRCKAVLGYLEYFWNRDIDLRKVPFLPALPKPPDWPLPWWGEEDHISISDDACNFSSVLICPENVTFENNKFLVGCVAPVLDENSLGKDFKRILQNIGVMNISDLSYETVMEQLETISCASFSQLDQLQLECLHNICSKTYSFLGKYWNPVRSLVHHQDKKIILVEDVLVTPKQCLMNLPQNCMCEPELFDIEKKWNHRLHELGRFFNKVGVRTVGHGNGESSFGKEDAMVVLKKYEEMLDTSVEESTATLVINLLHLVHHLTDGKLAQSEIKALFAPDSENVLRRPDDICIEDDYEKLSGQSDLHTVHAKMTTALNQMLRIRTKRAKYISRFDLGIPFGQTEDLTTRLRGILDDNPSTVTVFNELLQNADDAKASRIHYILDKRNHGTKYILEDTMRVAQGPALCVFNDSSFSNEDLQGISKLGEGSKRYDFTKTGQFGIGFNAVYSLTDLPSILSKGPETPNGGTLVIFDPHRKYIPDNGEPGIRIPELDIVETRYPDMYKAHLQCDKSLTSATGTWFRFPLRTWNMASTSKIRNEETSHQSIEETLSQIEEHCEKSLLFLTNVREIRASVIQENGTIREIFEVKSSIGESHMGQLSEFMATMKKNMKLIKMKEETFANVGCIHTEYDIHVLNTKARCTEKRSWRVVQTFNSPNEMPELIENAIQRNAIRLSPRGGVAFMYTERQSFKKGNAFCFLPLAMENTGLPVHVNGHFVLHSSRSSIWEDVQADPSVQGMWNKHMLESIVPYSYSILLKGLSKDVSSQMDLQVFYDAFPSLRKCTSDQWKRICRGVFQMLIDREDRVFPVINKGERQGVDEIRWVCLHKPNSCSVYFNDIFTQLKENEKESKQGFHSFPFSTSTHDKLDEDELLRKADTLTFILKDTGMKVTDAPLSIFTSIEESECKVDGEIYKPEIVQPQSVINFIKTWSGDKDDRCLLENVGVKVIETIFKNPQRVKIILDYCFHKGQNTELLEELPLQINELKELNVFSKDNPIIVSYYYHLLPASRELFLNRTLIPCLIKHTGKRESQDVLLALTLEAFSALIEKSLGLEAKDSPNTLQGHTCGILTEKWIVNFWEFINDITKATPAENKPSIPEKCRQLLQGWTLVPSKCAGSEKTVLYSFEEEYAVLDTSSFITNEGSDRTLNSALISLQIPKPHVDIQRRVKSLLSYFIANDRNPQKVVKCMAYHSQHLRAVNEEVRRKASLPVLKYFDFHARSLLNSAQDMKNDLCKIPLHASLDEQISELPLNREILQSHAISDLMPRNGISVVAEKENKFILRDNPSLQSFYQKVLGVRRVGELQIYVDYLLPHSSDLGKDVLFLHIEYLKNTTRSSAINDNDIVMLRNALTSVKFITSPTGVLKTANCFFSPHIDVFNMMCPEDELPPYPFNTKEWKQFMTLAGMITKASEDKIIQFATELSTVNSVTTDVRKKSECLVRYIFGRPDLYQRSYFLTSLSTICFLVPHVVSVAHQTIYAQFHRDQLISYRDSIRPESSYLGWTTCPIIDEYANLTRLQLH